MNADLTARLRLLFALATVFCLAACTTAGAPPGVPAAAELAALEARYAQDSVDTRTAIRLAQAYRAANRLEAAGTLLERVLTRAANHSDAALLLGATYEDLGRFADARTLYRSYIEKGSSARIRKELQQRLPLLQRRELEALVRATLTREAELATAAPQPFTVAVFPFQFVGVDPQFAPLGRALAEFLVNDLSQTSRLKVVERAQVQLLLDELKFAQSGAVDPATAARTGRLLGAERVVQGSMDGAERALNLESSIVRVGENTWPGETNVPLTEQDQLSALSAMQKRLALKIYASLGIDLTEAERERVTRRTTENLNAILAFGRGLQAEDGGDFRTAARHYAEAARIDPNFSAARTSAARVNDAATASSVDTRTLTASADAAAAPAVEEFFLPNPIARDAAAEVLRTEGAGKATIIELIIRRR